jgi:hypothetical protein
MLLMLGTTHEALMRSLQDVHAAQLSTEKVKVEMLKERLSLDEILGEGVQSGSLRGR